MNAESCWRDLGYALRQLARSPGFTAVAVLTLSILHMRREWLPRYHGARRLCGGRRPGSAMNIVHAIDELRRDATRALRAFARSRRFASVVVVTLAVGIGATTAMYSAIDAAFFRPLPFPNPDRLVLLDRVQVPIDTGRQRWRLDLEHADLDALRDVFASVGAYATGGLNLGSGLEPRRVKVTFVTTEFFTTLKRDAGLGRVFTRDETLAGAPNVAVLSDALWRSQFGADAAIVGRTVVLDDVPYEVVGVMPRDFRFPAEAQLWAPLPVPVPASMMGAFRNFLPSHEVARLADGASLETARARLEMLRAELMPGGERASPQSTVNPVMSLQRIGTLKSPFRAADGGA